MPLLSPLPSGSLASGSDATGSASSRLLTICLASLLAAVGLFAGTPVRAQTLPPSLPAPRVHIKRYNPGGTVSPKGTPVCNSPALSYYEGPVISNAQIVPVFWNSNVNSVIQKDISQFYSDATVSNWFDLLSEYSSIFGTGQSIGRGTSQAGIVITPSLCPATTTSTCALTDAELQTELTAQINASVLPPLQMDLAGNVNTIYMVFFPPNVTLSLDGIKSCEAGGFCAYHNTGTFGTANTPMPYGAMMDEFSGGCSTGCGSSPTDLENQTSTASHELAEATTDTDIGLFTGNSLAAPVGWYDGNNNCGEIADICDNDTSGYTITVDGRTWAVQQLWSNALGACVTTGLHPIYQISAPTTVVAGTQFDFTLTVNNPSGSKGTDIAYNGTVSFGSNDPQATLPANYTFTSANQGTLTFSATLATVGNETISATDGANSAIVGSAMIVVTGPATMQSPTQGSTLGTTNVQFTWNSSGATAYELFLGTNGKGSSNLYKSGSTTATTVTVPSIPADLQTVYAYLCSELSGAWKCTSSSYVESGTPTPATLQTPTPGNTLGTTNVQFTWGGGVAATAYELYLGTNGTGSSNLYNSGKTTATTVTVPSIPADLLTVYAYLCSEIGTQKCTSATYKEGGTPTPAVIETPAQGSTLGTTNVQFTWNTGVGVAQYELFLGTNGPGSSNLYYSGKTTATTVTVPSLPSAGSTVYAYFCSEISGSWKCADYTYKEQ